MCQDGITLNNSATSKRALRTSGTVCFTCTYAVLTPHVMDHTHWSPLLYATFYGSALPTVSLFMLVRMMSVNNIHTVRVCMYLYQPHTVPQHTHTTLHRTTPSRFWQACRDLQTIPLGSVKKSVHLIYEEFLSSSAASAVNLSAAVRKEAKEDANPAQRYSFVTAQIQVLELMRKDVYPRFLKSPEYLEYLNNEKPATFGRK